MNRRVAVLISFIGVNLIACCCAGVGPSKETNHETASKELQDQRKQLIDDLMNKDRVFHKYNFDGPIADLWVTPRFMALDIDSKTTFCNVVFAYAFALPKVGGDHAGKTLTLYHSISGKEVGSYNYTDGLVMR